MSDANGGLARGREAAVHFQQTEGVSVSTDVSARTEKRSISLGGTSPLFGYQQEVVDALRTARVEGRRACLVSMPTGAGKTRTAVWFLRHQIEQAQECRAIWLAPSVELVDQAVQAIEQVWREFPTERRVTVRTNDIVRSPNTGPPSIAVATLQLAARNLESIRSCRPTHLVFDEAHYATTRTFRKTVETVLGHESGTVIGLTATPGRTGDDEQYDLADLFENRVLTPSSLGKDPIAALRAMGVLSDVRSVTIELPKQWNQARARTVGGGTNIGDLSMLPARFRAVSDAIVRIGEERRCLVFCHALDHCYALAGDVAARGVSVGVVSHATSAEKRKSLLSRFEEGEIKVILNRSILATGYDCPAISDVVLASPVKSPIAWEQIVGRASRGPAVGGESEARIWEVDDHHAMHGAVQSYARYMSNWDPTE
jgi:DNA repair protein RadD